MAAGHLRAVEPPERRRPARAVVHGRRPGQDRLVRGLGAGRLGACGASSSRAGRLAEEDRLSPRFMWMAAKEMRAKLTEVKGEPAWRPTTFLEQGMTDVKSALDVARTYGAALERGPAVRRRALPGRRSSSFYDVGGAAQDHRTTTGSTPTPTPPTWFVHWRRWIAPARAGPRRAPRGSRRSCDGDRTARRVRLRHRDVQPRRRARRLRPERVPVRCSWGEGWGAGRLRRSPPSRTWRARRSRATASWSDPSAAAIQAGRDRGRARAPRSRSASARGAGAPRSSQSAIAASSQPGAPQRAASVDGVLEVGDRLVGAAGRGREHAQRPRDRAERGARVVHDGVALRRARASAAASCRPASGAPHAATGSASRTSPQSQSGVRSTAAKPSRAHAATRRAPALAPRAPLDLGEHRPPYRQRRVAGGVVAQRGERRLARAAALQRQRQPLDRVLLVGVVAVAAVELDRLLGEPLALLEAARRTSRARPAGRAGTSGSTCGGSPPTSRAS